MPICRCFRGESPHLFHAFKCLLRSGALARSDASTAWYTAAGSVRHILSWRFGHEKIFTVFSPFKKGSCQLLAKEYVLSTCKLPRRLAQEVWIG